MNKIESGVPFCPTAQCNSNRRGFYKIWDISRLESELGRCHGCLANGESEHSSRTVNALSLRIKKLNLTKRGFNGEITKK
ncbi:MAG: hypothetical protein A3F91_09475 [Flavobacteria bacterium RIFCSPLOWO2_12_FULL_35_11]|nr:MAG: hypothetical protein A3F91_09475 [Flavobacteria bacterium RIFCSPLOWO2_12_FULL_35_11]